MEKRKIKELLILTLVASNRPWWEYTHHGKWQMLQMPQIIISGELVIKHLSADYWVYA